MTAQPGTSGGGADDDADEDVSTFRAAMRGVRPLPQAQERPAAPRTRRPQPRAGRAPAAAAPAAASGEFAPRTDALALAADRLSYRRPGVRDQQMRRLRRGSYPVEDELDLHGMTQAGAHGVLGEFIDASRAQGKICVRIIHGKGLRSGGRGAVLKAAVNDWLRHRHEVIAFTSARPLDGGAGALYVLLRA